MAVQRPAGLEAALVGAHVGLHHGLVLLDREQQRDVDVHPVEQRLLDRRDALRRRGDLDHQVRPVDKVPVHVGLLE